MKKSGLTALLFVLFVSASYSQAPKGHPFWWWGTKRSDFIVEGLISFDPTKYFELKPVNIDGQDKTHYWLIGKLRIDKVRYINSHSGDLESYQQYLKMEPKEHDVLIPASRSQFISFHAPANDKVYLRPMFGLDIPDQPTVFNLSHLWAFPFLMVKLDSVVPIENLKEAEKLINERQHNFIRSTPDK